MKKFINNFITNLKASCTRKKTLYIAIIMIIIYAVVDCIFSFISVKLGVIGSLDSTLTSEWFSFWRWVVAFGGAITVAKVAKGENNNSDEGE